MKLITVEEHYGVPFALPRKPGSKPELPVMPGTLPGAPILDDLGSMLDLGEGRLKAMDEAGVTMQVLSLPAFIENVESNATEICRNINNHLADAISKHPDRFAGFATLPLAEPEACADELERAVTELGFVGSAVPGRVDGRFLSDSCFEPFLAKSEELGAPIYLHPGLIPQNVIDLCYTQNLEPDVIATVSKYGFGWHIDAGIHMLNLVLTGVFDRHPNLQIILGHWGELLPYYFDRFDAAMPASFIGTAHDPSYYLRNNMYITSSGIYTPELLEYCKSMMGIDRILFSIDYPCCTEKGKEKILEHPKLSVEEREKISYKNAEALLKL